MRHYLLPSTVLLGGLLLTACVDKSYDLDDVDMTLAANTNLALPLINTSSIKLVDFVLPSDFLNTTTIPGQDGKVIYAHTTGDFSANITTLADGELEYTAETPDITIPELPDFLKGDNVHLDLKNPIIIANVKGENLPDGCNILADIEISTPEGTCKVNGLRATRENSCQYIAEKADNNIPADILKAEYGTPVLLKPETGSSVNALFKNKIPEKLQISISKLTASNVGPVPVSGSFDIAVELTLYSPLCVGSSKFSLSYEALETDWAKEFNEDVRKMQLEKLLINANLINNLPLTAEVTMVPIDPEGNPISGLNVLKTSATGGKTNTIEYTLQSNKANVTLRDYLNGSNGAQQLDGVKIVSTLKANTESVGKYITDNASVRFTGLELRAIGTFIYDAN